jgi:hypothetical protein
MAEQSSSEKQARASRFACAIDGPTRGRPWSSNAVRREGLVLELIGSQADSLLRVARGATRDAAKRDSARPWRPSTTTPSLGRRRPRSAAGSHLHVAIRRCACFERDRWSRARSGRAPSAPDTPHLTTALPGQASVCSRSIAAFGGRSEQAPQAGRPGRSQPREKQKRATSSAQPLSPATGRSPMVHDWRRGREPSRLGPCRRPTRPHPRRWPPRLPRR